MKHLPYRISISLFISLGNEENTDYSEWICSKRYVYSPEYVVQPYK